MRTIRFNGELYEWSADPCLDSDELAVCLDFGNGVPEHIGYADSISDARSLVLDELEKVSA
jgi:hypothetical protein